MIEPPLLELVGVTKRFGSVVALEGVDLRARSGEVTAVVGDNGAGKSTLVSVMAGHLAPDAGEVRFAGRPVRPGVALPGISAVPQDLALCDNLDVVANVFLGTELRSRRVGALSETAMELAAAAALAQMGLRLGDLRVPVARLSGGQRQMVGLARALIGAPRLVLLDEPTTALGLAATGRVLALIRRLRQDGRGVILVSHRLADVLAVSDRVVVLRHGRVAAELASAATTAEEIVAAVTGAGLTGAEDARTGTGSRP